MSEDVCDFTIKRFRKFKGNDQGVSTLEGSHGET